MRALPLQSYMSPGYSQKDWGTVFWIVKNVPGIAIHFYDGMTKGAGGDDGAGALTLLNMAVFLMAWTSSGASGGSRYLSLVSSQFCLYKT